MGVFRVGSLQPGDIILAINGESLDNSTHHDAIELLQGSEDTVTLTMMRASTNDFSKSCLLGNFCGRDILTSCVILRLCEFHSMKVDEYVMWYTSVVCT